MPRKDQPCQGEELGEGLCRLFLFRPDPERAGPGRNGSGSSACQQDPTSSYPDHGLQATEWQPPKEESYYSSSYHNDYAMPTVLPCCAHANAEALWHHPDEGRCIVRPDILTWHLGRCLTQQKKKKVQSFCIGPKSNPIEHQYLPTGPKPIPNGPQVRERG